MNNLLQKCLDELAKEQPKLDYLRGILETLIAANQPMKSLVSTTIKFPDAGLTIPPVKELLQDEAATLDSNARAMMAKIPKTLDV